MIKTTLTKLKKAYSTLSFAPRALGLETNGKFYKLIVSILRRADKRTKPDKTEEECERGEVIAKLMLEPSETTAIFSQGLSKPEALQKTSFLAPPVENKQREKSTLSNKDESEQNDLNKPVCNLQEVAESITKSLPHSMIQPETQVNEAPHTDTETHRQETVFSETKKIDPPNSLQNAIPDIILDKKYFDACPDGKTTDTTFCSPEKENSNGNKNNILNNLQNSTGPVEVNNTIHSKQSAFIQSRFYDRDNDSPSIKFFASYDKTKKPPSTETNSSLDELAKHCLDSPNNKIDERLLKEMKKLGVPQTSPRSENSVIEENIIQMDVLRKPRKPTEKTEIDVETTKFEHPPLSYSDEQRLEIEPRTAEEEELFGPMQNNKKETTVLASSFCNVRLPTIDKDKPLLNPFDKRKIKLDDESSFIDVKDAKNYYHTKAPGVVQLEKTNEPLKCLLVNSRNYNVETDKPLEFHNLSKNNADKKNIGNSSNPTKLSMVSENNAENTNSTDAYLQPKSEQDSTTPSKGIVDNVTMCSTPLKVTNTVDDQPKAELGSEKPANFCNYAVLSQDAPSVADEPHQMYKLTEDKVHTTTISSTWSKNAKGVDFQAEGELAYNEQQSENKSGNMVNQETEERRKLENICCDPVPKKPEPFLVFDPPEQESVKLNIHTNQKESKTANEDFGTKHNVSFVQPLKSLRIRCNVLPTKNTDEKATISLLLEIDAYKQPKEEIAPQNEPDVTYREESANQQKDALNYLNKFDHITRDKVTLILPEKQEKPKEAQVDSIPEEKPEIPLSEMLKRVRSRNRAEYCQQLEKSLQHELGTEVETITGKCGDKKPRCPPRCPPSKKSACPSPCSPPARRPACPRPCKPAGPPPCPLPCPKPACPPSRCGNKKCGNPCCPGSSRSKGGNPCCPGSSRKKGGNPCCPGSSSGNKGGNPCCPGSSSSPSNPCKFSAHLPSIMMNSIVSLIDQRLTIADTELAQNQLFMVTKDAYQRFLYSACFAEFYRPHLLPILNICGIDASLGNCESMNSNLARDYDPWVPIPCWPVPKKEAKKPLVCPNKGCQIPLPGKNRPPCYPYPCHGFPKRKNSFSIIDLYACWSNPNGRQ